MSAVQKEVIYWRNLFFVQSVEGKPVFDQQLYYFQTVLSYELVLRAVHLHSSVEQ